MLRFCLPFSVFLILGSCSLRFIVKRMGLGFFNLGLDPKAGEWKHEILWRLFYGLASIFMATVPISHIIQTISPPLGEVLVCGMAGFFFSLPEGVIRKNALLGLLTVVSCSMAASLGLIVTYYFEHDFLKGIVIVLVCLGGALGLCAGIGSRSFLATVLGFLAGQCSGYGSGQSYPQLTAIVSTHELYVLVFQVLLGLYLPIGLSIGLAVWLGVKLSKRSQSNA